jgi:tRNA (cytidine/uridine-2'-O-)-methyltransferase
VGGIEERQGVPRGDHGKAGLDRKARVSEGRAAGIQDLAAGQQAAGLGAGTAEVAREQVVQPGHGGGSSIAPGMPALHIVLVEPEIHWNTGNVGRTSLAVGAELHLVEPLGFSLDERRVRRAGLDYWPRVRLRVWPGWAALERALPELGEPFFFTASAPRPPWEVAFPERTVLVFGRESVGLPADLLARHPDRTVAIPMADPGLRSLNLSTAAAIAAYEVVRQRETGRMSACSLRQRG